MENEQPLVFQTEVAKNKPENIVHTDHVCPFCDVAHLTDILDQAGEKIWLVNKFRTLQHTWQTVVIESAKHDGDFSNYSLAESRQIIEFALVKWQETQQNL